MEFLRNVAKKILRKTTLSSKQSCELTQFEAPTKYVNRSFAKFLNENLCRTEAKPIVGTPPIFSCYASICMLFSKRSKSGM